MNSLFSSKMNEICSHLEHKYGEKFVVARLVSDDGTPDVPNKAYAYPEGRETDWFAVRFSMDKNFGMSDFRDGYGFIFAEHAILPAYDTWITNVVPGAKFSLRIKNEWEITRVIHLHDVTFADFIKQEMPFAINISVFIRDNVLYEKERLLTSLSQKLNVLPYKDLSVTCQVIFICSDKFDLFKPQHYKGFSFLEFAMYVSEMKAYTKVWINKHMSVNEIIISLSESFNDEIKLQIEMEGKEND